MVYETVSVKEVLDVYQNVNELKGVFHMLHLGKD